MIKYTTTVKYKGFEHAVSGRHAGYGLYYFEDVNTNKSLIYLTTTRLPGKMQLHGTYVIEYTEPSEFGNTTRVKRVKLLDRNPEDIIITDDDLTNEDRDAIGEIINNYLCDKYGSPSGGYGYEINIELNCIDWEDDDENNRENS